MKSAFSLLELVFAIVILGIVASFAIPKYLDTKDSALASTIKRDLNTATNSIQTYYLLNQKIDKISDAIEMDTPNWDYTDTKLTDKHECLSLEIKSASSGVKTLELSVDSSKDLSICKKLRDSGIDNKVFELY